MVKPDNASAVNTLPFASFNSAFNNWLIKLAFPWDKLYCSAIDFVSSSSLYICVNIAPFIEYSFNN